MSNVLEFNGTTKLDIPPERVLQKAIDRDMQRVCVIGYDRGGDLYLASSFSDLAEILWLLEHMKKNLLEASLT